MEDRRRSLRATPSPRVVFIMGALAMRGLLANLSVDGVFVETSLPADPGAALRLVFELAGETVRAEARVVHSVSHRGMGVEFTSISAAHRELIRDAVSRGELQAVHG